MVRLCLVLPWCLYAGVVHVTANEWWGDNEDYETLEDPSALSSTGLHGEEEYNEDASWCECVPWYLCEDNVINTDGAGIIGARIFDKPVKNVENCPLEIHTCCGIPADTDSDYPDSEEPGSHNTELPPGTPCNCMSYQECPQHLIVNDGHGETCLNVAGTSSSHSKCPRAMDVCCASSNTESEVASLLTSSSHTDYPNYDSCDCVKPHLCDNLLPFSHNPCHNSNLVCCRPRVECECVNQNMCDEEGFIKTDGEGLIDLRSLGNQSESQGRCDDPCQICCKIREITTTTLISTTEPSDQCYCVEESQCNDGHEEDYNFGEGFLNPRMLCSNPEHICCYSPVTEATTSPSITTTQPPIVTQNCGNRIRKNTLNVRIMGFRDGQSQFGEFPWVATLLQEETNINQGEINFLFIGGGTLIHPHVVLTAAHKINNLRMRTDKLYVRLGEWDTQTDKEPLPHQDIEVEKIVIHPQYNKQNLKHDVALIFLKEESAFNEHIQHICMAYDISEVDPTDCVINGWGKDGFGTDAMYQKILKSVTLPLVDSNKCQKQLRKTRLGRRFRLHKSFLCAGGEAGIDSCKGDGGGPLACARRDDKDKYLLVGITAWGIGCGDEGVPGVYVNVPLHFDWITEQIESVHPSTPAPTTTTAPPTTTTEGCPTDCPSDFDPMCGSNGNTYGNPCELRLAGCHDTTITLSHHGECEHKKYKKKLKEKKKQEKKAKKKEERKKRREQQ